MPKAIVARTRPRLPSAEVFLRVWSSPNVGLLDADSADLFQLHFPDDISVIVLKQRVRGAERFVELFIYDFSPWYIVANLPKAVLNAERGRQEWVEHNRPYRGKEIAAESYSAMPRYLHVANAEGRAADVLDTVTFKGSVYLTSHWK